MVVRTSQQGVKRIKVEFSLKKRRMSWVIRQDLHLSSWVKRKRIMQTMLKLIIVMTELGKRFELEN